MWPRVDGLRTLRLGSPGEMQDRLNALILAGKKVATAGLWRYDYVDQDEPLDVVGERQILLAGLDEQPLAVLDITRVETHPFAEVPWEFAAAEGEGFESIEHWRQGHRTFYANQGICVGDDELVVCVWLRVVQAVKPNT